MKQSILLIEDNIEMQSLLRLILEEEGYRVVSAINGHDALNVLHTHEHLNLILLDLNLPGMKSNTLLATIEDENLANGVPIVFFSALPNLAEIKLPKRISGVIQKPFQIDQFLSKIRSYKNNEEEITFPMLS